MTHKNDAALATIDILIAQLPDCGLDDVRGRISYHFLVLSRAAIQDELEKHMEVWSALLDYFGDGLDAFAHIKRAGDLTNDKYVSELLFGTASLEAQDFDEGDLCRTIDTLKNIVERTVWQPGMDSALIARCLRLAAVSAEQSYLLDQMVDHAEVSSA